MLRLYSQDGVFRFGVPSVLTSDCETQFTSSLWKELCLLLGISYTKTTLFHPQSNVMVERSHNFLKSSLRSKLAGSDWIHHQLLVLLGLRSAPKGWSSLFLCRSCWWISFDAPEFPSEIFKSGVSSDLLSFSAPTNHHVISTKVMVPEVPSTRERSWQAPLDCSPPSAALPLVRFSSLLSPPSSLPSLPSSPVLRRNPPRVARQPTTASSPCQPRRWCWGELLWQS